MEVGQTHVGPGVSLNHPVYWVVVIDDRFTSPTLRSRTVKPGPVGPSFWQCWHRPPTPREVSAVSAPRRRTFRASLEPVAGTLTAA